ncbi:MAG TPA: STAS domain-containing protein [Candidatus Deferrimicrobium sp.]|nr:STAS domain-containing protein [Candidatus Deferrimicrobium sp.]
MKSFYIRSKVLEDTAVLYPKGHLDAHNVDRFEKEMVKLIGNHVVNIIVNCKELNYISSAGMGIIMGYLDEIREKGGDIKLCCVDERVYEIFDLVGFTEIYDFLDNEETAIAKFKV